MHDVEHIQPQPPGTAQVPQQRHAPPMLPQQRGATSPPVLVLQNTTWTSGRAIASMILGVLSLAVGGPILGVPAMLLSISADGEIARSRGKIGGITSARIGFWTGVVGSLFGIYVFFLVLTAVGVAVPVPQIE
jgi:hypothetical protein